MSSNVKKGDIITIKNANMDVKHLIISSEIVNENNLDCDLMAFLLNKDDVIKDRWNIVFYNNLQDDIGSVIHLGDSSINQLGCEEILVSFDKIPADCEKIVLLLSIYDAENRNQNLSMIQKANISLIDADEKKELFCCELTPQGSSKRGITIGTFFREDERWLFQFQNIEEDEHMVVSLSERYGMRRDWRYFRNR